MTTLNTPYLQLAHLTKTFGAFQAVADVSLTVNRGEFICFLGPSGCGKTTLLRIIAGLEIQDSGTIIQDQTDVSRAPASERDFGIVFQSYALFPNLTVAKNIAYGLENRRTPRAEIDKRVTDLLTLVSLTGSEKKYPTQLSGGQQQRVALARALALSPGLLLLDEPLSALDARVRANLRGELSSLQRRLGVTTIMVTHDQEEALTLADRIVVMNKGRIEQIGTPAEIYHTPATPFVADFVGVMNFMPAVLQASGTLKAGAFELSLNGSTPKVPSGSAVTLAIRPEKIRLSATQDRGAVAARVHKVEFLGSFYRLYLQVPDNAPLTVDSSAAEVEALSIQPDSTVYVVLPANSIRVYAHG